jgi:hypothetical protein
MASLKKRLEYNLHVNSMKIVNDGLALPIRIESEEYTFLGLRGAVPRYKVLMEVNNWEASLISYIIGHDYNNKILDILVVFKLTDFEDVTLRGGQDIRIFIENI